MNLHIKSKNVLVVGASKGIGRGIATAFAEEGARMTIVARSSTLLQEIIAEIHTLCPDEDHQYYATDLMDGSANATAQQLLDERGTFDIVVHCVGGSLVSRNALGTLQEWQHAWYFNAGLAIDMNNKLIPPMIEKQWGRVIHISSISAKTLRGNPLYASAKAYLDAYVTTVGRELASTGVSLAAVQSGAVAFEGSYWDNHLKTDSKRCEDFLRQHQAVGRFGSPREVANVVLFLASEQASFMQAAVIPVDGANM